MTAIWSPLVSEFSILTAFLFFLVFTILCYCLCEKSDWHMLWAIALGVLFTIVRALFPVELPGMKNIRLSGFFSKIFYWSNMPILGNFSFFHFFLLFWLIGTAFLLIRFGVRILRYALSVSKEDFLPDARMKRLYEEALRDLGCPKKGELTMTRNSAIAYSTGFFRPKVVFPCILESQSDEHISLVLKHEILHYMYHDLWIKAVVKILCYLLWWNLAVYLLSFSVDHLLELRCDSRVCKNLDREQILNYYEVLLSAYKIQSAQSKRKKRQLLQIGLLGRLELRKRRKDREVKKRFAQILKASRGEQKQKKTSIVIAVAIFVLFLSSYTVTFQTSEFPSEEEIGMAVTNYEDDSSYIVRHPDGTLEVFIDHQMYGILDPKRLEEEPFSSMLIVDVY